MRGGVTVDKAQLLANALGHMEKALILLDEAGCGAEASYQQYAISLAQAKLREVCAVSPPREH